MFYSEQNRSVGFIKWAVTVSVIVEIFEAIFLLNESIVKKNKRWSADKRKSGSLKNHFDVSNRRNEWSHFLTRGAIL